MSKAATRIQVSAGGVIFREENGRIEVAVIAVEGGEEARWQLPKGIVGPDEPPELTAVREVREETGLNGQLIGPIDTIEYWYYARGGKVRFHKYVHFYLMRYESGRPDDHDHEVLEARWVAIDRAVEMLAFKNEREMVERAREMIEKLPE